jgi:hypothetical protein
LGNTKLENDSGKTKTLVQASSGGRKAPTPS